MNSFVTMVQLTLYEALRRRVLAAVLVCGLAFLVLFAIGFHFIAADFARHAGVAALERRLGLTFLTLAGLFAVNFLTLMTAVLLPVDTLSGEIESGVMQTLAAKPITRSAILLGKWTAFAIVMVCYLAMMAGGVLIVARVIGHLGLQHVERGLPLMALEGLVLLSVSIAGGTRFSTITNGIIAFGLYGIAFIGNWVEQIGTMTGNDTARNVGTIASLVMPSDVMGQLAAHHMQPPIMRDLQLSPFSTASVPSPAMVWWAVGYVAVTLAIALRQFRRRAL
jgi:ABC-type transport system involved in multi-copper enzyme maturation permease subunit